MNEGWASLWHKRILDSLELPQDLHLEFLVRHNQVVRPHPGSLNPYHLGLKLWDDIRRRFDESTPEDRERSRDRSGEGLRMIFEARSADRDVSFLRRFLTEDVMREIDLFRYESKGNDLVVTDVADPDGWEKVKETLLKSIGTGSIPVIRVLDGGFGSGQVLYLEHEHDGRDLQLEYGERTLAYVYRLWGREVALETVVSGRRTLLTYNDKGFASKALKA